MTWQVLILGAIVALGLFATIVQIGALRVATRKVPTPPTPSIRLRDEPVAIARTDYFELGLQLGRARQFDDRVLRDLSDECKKLGLSYSAAKVDHILDTFSQERDEIEIEGGTITETLALFNFQMRDMEDVVRTELVRNEAIIPPLSQSAPKIPAVPIISPLDKARDDQPDTLPASSHATELSTPSDIGPDRVWARETYKNIMDNKLDPYWLSFETTHKDRVELVKRLEAVLLGDPIEPPKRT